MGEIAFDRVGSGEPLVLIHGLGSRRRAWDPVVELIAGQREVLNLDLPGFGDSAPDPAGTKLTVADHVDRVEELIDGQGFERPHVAGNSLGGGIALELGRRGGARTVTAFSPVGFWGRAGQSWCRLALRAGWEAGQRLPEAPSPRFELALTRLGLFIPSFGRPFKVSAEEVRATREAGLQAPGFLDALDYGLDYRFGRADDLRGLPVTVAWGRRDVLLLYWTQSRAARRALPLARHITLPRCGHVPFHDDPQLCARVVLDGSRDGVA